MHLRKLKPEPSHPKSFAPRTVAHVEEHLRSVVEGEVRFDSGTRALYAADASNYRQVPIGVVLPRSIDDVVATVSVCREHDIPLLSRGCGTSLAGQCCNVAVIVDWSKYLNRVLEINAGQKWARVQPGVIMDDLRNQALQHGLTFGPDPATHNHCTLGGMLGNNSCGIHAQMAGKTVDNTEELEILTYDGTRLNVGWMDEAAEQRWLAAGGRQAEIMNGIRQIRQRYARLIHERFPDIPRRVSGYNLDQLLPGPDGRYNLARALVGSESTLVAILEARMRLVHNPAERVLVVLGFPDVYQAADAVPAVLPFQPTGLEGMDEMLVEDMKATGVHRESLKYLPGGKGWLLVEFGGDTRAAAEEQAHRMMSSLGAKPHAPNMRLYQDREEEQHVWKARESGLGATAFIPGKNDSWPGWEDSAVAPEKMGDYLRSFCKLLQKYDYRAALYGHFGMGCLHCRIDFDLRSNGGRRKFHRFIGDAADLVSSMGGSLSGEHGDGQARAEFLPRMFGPEIVRAFGEFKALWDPRNRMNPGKIVDPYTVVDNLRLRSYPHWEPKTVFNYPNDGGAFSHAVLRCVGIGKCRRTHSDEADNNTMCPSFMVTREERHTTRGRAHLLWEMLEKGPIQQGWKSEEVKEGLDLCLSCKGCKGDCPVNVDMATYKAEFLYHYWKGRLRPRHAYAFGWIDRWARLASVAPSLVNLATQTPGVSAVAKWMAGMPQERHIPAFAPENFQSWFARREQRLRPQRMPDHAPEVILWPDTFNNYFMPWTAQAAVDVLENAGYRVRVPAGHFCCGRPLYDYGMLDRAKSYLNTTMKRLRPEIDAGTPIVVLEPSCAAVFRDELGELYPDRPEAQKLGKQVLLLSEFLEHKADYQPPHLSHHAIVQGHCHHKAVMKMDAEAEQLARMGLDAELLPSGCCGMAGSFGFEEDKYDISRKVGEHSLLPKVRQADAATLIIANGFSCREQIQQLSDRHALHIAEVMQMALQEGRAPEAQPWVESAIMAPREKQVRSGMLRAAAALAVAAGAAIGAAVLLWRGNRGGGRLSRVA